jgi:hypothetical protein
VSGTPNLSHVPSGEENAAKLHACPRHDFFLVRHKSEPGEVPQRRSLFRCSRCGGHVRSTAAHWYAAGLAHGSGKSQWRRP